ncbi:MAG: amino acid adenylation domain-containing protein, partial [Methanobrevibacter sp.]|nr:amino acid adenylation domain-containing protein [Methanobrevibacter sp.]
MSKIIGHNKFGVTTNLLSVGFTSLSIIKLLNNIFKEFNINLDLTEILKDSTIENIAILINNSENNTNNNTNSNNDKNKNNNNDNNNTLNINDENKDYKNKFKKVDFKNKLFPLTDNQLGILYDFLEKPNTTVYNIPFVAKFNKSIDVNKLKIAILKTINLHPYLNTTFINKNGELYQKNSDWNVNIDIFNEELTDSIKYDFVQPFDLFKEPLYRFAIYNTGDEVFILSDFNHIIFDGFSFNIFFDDLIGIYNGESVEEETYTGYDLAIEEDEFKKTSAYKESKEFFNDKLSSFDGVSELTHFSLNDGISESDVSSNFHKFLDIPHDNVLKACNSLNITPNILFLAAFNLTVNKFTFNHDTFIATISSNRENPQYLNTIAMLVKTFPLILHTNNELNIKDYILDIRDSYLNTLKHSYYPLSSVVADFDISPDILFAYQGTIDEAIKDMSFESLDSGAPKFKFFLNIFDTLKSFKFDVEYYNDLYSEEFIETFLNSFKSIVDDFTTDINNKNSLIKDIAIVKQNKSFTLKDIPHRLLTDIFNESVRENHDKIALISNNEEYTYKELNKKANVIANSLIKNGANVNDKIMFILHRDSNLVATILAILKSGCTFIPIDPDYPEGRIKHVLEDSEAKFIISTNDLLDKLGNNFNHDVLLDINNLLDNYEEFDESDEFNEFNEFNEFKSSNFDNINNLLSPDSLAYIIYTSGSTGLPKGVMITHENISNYLTPFKENIAIVDLKNKSKRVLSITTVAFDLFVHDLFSTLATGLTFVFANDNEYKDPISMVKLFKRANVDVINLTPSRLSQYLEFNDFRNILDNCSILFVGGEKFSVSLYKNVRKYTDADIFNVYGPTETTISCNTSKLQNNHITVGKPLLNVVESVMDIDGNPLPPGVMGELYVGGLGVSKGYLNRGELTANQFVLIDGIRYYKTGDFAIEDNTPGFKGEYIIQGRIDHQIKLRGLRIEIGEIETLINEYDGVKRAAVTVKTINSNEFLCAYFVSEDKDNPVNINDLKAYLSDNLVGYMVPSYFVELDDFPMTPNGKIDLKELPSPNDLNDSIHTDSSSNNLDLDDNSYLHSAINAPSNYVEEEISIIVTEILNHDNFNINSNLLEIGFTSLSIINLIMKLHDKFNIDLNVSDIMENNSIRNISNEIIKVKFLNNDFNDNTALNDNIALNNNKNNIKDKHDLNKNFDVDVDVDVNVDDVSIESSHSDKGHLYPLTQNQFGIYLDYLKHPEKLVYNIPFACTFDKSIDIDKLKSSIIKAIYNHPYILVKLIEIKGKIYQVSPLDFNSNTNSN